MAVTGLAEHAVSGTRAGRGPRGDRSEDAEQVSCEGHVSSGCQSGGQSDSPVLAPGCHVLHTLAARPAARTPLGASRPQAFGVLPFLLQHPSSTDLMSPWTPPGRDPSTARSARRHRPPRAAAACPAPPRPARTETPSRVCGLHVHVAGWPAHTRRRGGPLGPPLTPQRWEGQRGQRVAMPAGPPSPSRRDGEEVDSHVD